MPPTPLPARPLAVAHRGGNSAAALAAALAAGADVVEADVQEVRGVLEVHHWRWLRPLPVLLDGRRVALLRGERWTLAELMDALPPAVLVLLDLKAQDARAGAVVAAALRRRPPQPEVLVCGRHWLALDAFAAEPWARTVPSAGNRRELRRLQERLRSAPAGRDWGVSVRTQLLTRDVVDQLHERVEVVIAWHVPDLRTLDAVLAVGADAVTSDAASVLREAVRRRG